MSKKKTNAFNDSDCKCGFCGKNKNEVTNLIAGPNTFICNECNELISDIIKDQNQDDNKVRSPKGSRHSDNGLNKTPKEIKEYLDSYIIGQDSAKTSLALAAYTHYKRMANPDLKMKKSNVLMVGPTGTGKTLLVSTLAKLFDVPYAVCDATALTKAGYVGKDVENMLSDLYKAADDDIDKASRGIIYIDEIDKLAATNESGLNQHDVGGKSVQQALLKLLEGSLVDFRTSGDERQGKGEKEKIDTSNILFICSGAFVGLKDHSVEGLIQFGMIPEFMGRLPVVVKLNDLMKSDLVRILTMPKDSVVECYKNWFSTEKVTLVITPCGLDAIADLALERGTGARGLQGILENLVQTPMFEAPSLKSKHILTIDKSLNPVFSSVKKRATQNELAA